MIYITGANGWLGLNLIKSIVSGNTNKWGLETKPITAFIKKGSSKKRLLKISSEIKIIEGDLTNKKSLERLLNNAQDSLLFHIAGVIHPKRVKEFFDTNVLGTKNLIETATEAKIKKIIIMSSNSPFGSNTKKEILFNENSIYNPYMNYGKSKMEMEIIANQFYKMGKIDLAIIRSPWFYGPFQPKRQKLFFDMIQRGKIPITGDGNNIRSMAYTENIVQGLVLAATKNESSGETFWIADKVPYTMNQIVYTIRELLKTNFNQDVINREIRLPNFISNFAERFDHIIQYTGLYNKKIHVLSELNKNIACDISYAFRKLGYKPEFSLEQGMHESIKELYE